MKKLLIIALILIFGSGLCFAGNKNGKEQGNNNWGLVEVPELVYADFDDDQADCVVVCWEIPDEPVPGFYPAEKWSVVLFTTMYLEYVEACLDAYSCDTCPNRLDVKLSYSTKNKPICSQCSESVPVTFCNPEPYYYCMGIHLSLIEADLDAYLEEELADCFDCSSDCPEPTMTWDAPSAKVKGLDSPGKQRGTLWNLRDNKGNKTRQNSEFSNSRAIDNCFLNSL